MLATAVSIIGQIGLAMALAIIPAAFLGILVAWMTKTSGPMAGQGKALAFMIVAGVSYVPILVAILWWGL